MTMKSEDRRRAIKDTFAASDILGRLITHARSSMQPFTLPAEVLAKLVEAQQAVFAAQRLIEKETT